MRMTVLKRYFDTNDPPGVDIAFSTYSSAILALICQSVQRIATIILETAAAAAEVVAST